MLTPLKQDASAPALHASQASQIPDIHLIPTRSPSLTPEFSVPGPIFTILPMPSWPPTWPGWVGAGSMFHEFIITPMSEWQTPEWVL